tara:strand:- start:241 stop:876 length:636 start_codon:yes stop_codon:yes gene_type:complete
MISNKKKAFIARVILNLIYFTNIRIVNGRNYFKSELKKKNSVILCVWHAHLLSIVYDLKKLSINALAGTHRDADIISQIALKWGWKVIRGSSKENGDIAFRKIYRLLKKRNEILFITPDGPTGPPKIPKLGIIRAAQKTGASIIPIGVYSTKNWGFTNWDTFYLEKPFGKIFIEYGPPFNFSDNINSEKCKKTLIKKMNDIERKCFENAHK